MILTTTDSVEGRMISDYKGLVFGEVVAGIDFVKDFTAGIKNILGGRSESYEEELVEARNQAVREMIDRAAALGADAIVGIKYDYEILGTNNGMMMVNVSGTAVRLA